MGPDIKDYLGGFYLAENTMLDPGPWSRTLPVIILLQKGADARRKFTTAEGNPEVTLTRNRTCWLGPTGCSGTTHRVVREEKPSFSDTRDSLGHKGAGHLAEVPLLPDWVKCALNAPHRILSALPSKYVQNSTLLTIPITLTLN